MPLTDKVNEIGRLLKQFETEAAKYHQLTFETFYVTPQSTAFYRPVSSPHHAIMLWQYFGNLNGDEDIERFVNNLKTSNMQYGVRGVTISRFALFEGLQCELFKAMALRAGALFDGDEVKGLQLKITDDVYANEKVKATPGKPLVISNDNPLAIWTNYLLYYLSLTHPGREHALRIWPDPFTLSLLALERLSVDFSIGKADRSTTKLSELTFRVALSFPGEHRPFVSAVADTLRSSLGPDAVFYDFDYQAQLARPNLDVLLQDVYRNRSELVVVFLCDSYSKKEWCGLEWRAVRDIIKAKRDDQVMFVRFDDSNVDGVLSIDGYVDARGRTPQDIGELVLARIGAPRPNERNA